MRRRCDILSSNPPPPKVPLLCLSRWLNGGRGKGHGSYFEKFFLRVIDLKMPLKATFDLWPGDNEEGRLEPRELLEKLREREDEEDKDESRRRGPERKQVRPIVSHP